MLLYFEERPKCQHMRKALKVPLNIRTGTTMRRMGNLWKQDVIWINYFTQAAWMKLYHRSCSGTQFWQYGSMDGSSCMWTFGRHYDWSLWITDIMPHFQEQNKNSGLSPSASPAQGWLFSLPDDRLLTWSTPESLYTTFYQLYFCKASRLITTYWTKD